MKKLIIVAVVVGFGVAALRRFGPGLGERAMKKCQEMMTSHRGDMGAGFSGSCVTSGEPEVLAAASA